MIDPNLTAVSISQKPSTVPPVSYPETPITTQPVSYFETPTTTPPVSHIETVTTVPPVSYSEKPPTTTDQQPALDNASVVVSPPTVARSTTSSSSSSASSTFSKPPATDDLSSADHSVVITPPSATPSNPKQSPSLPEPVPAGENQTTKAAESVVNKVSATATTTNTELYDVQGNPLVSEAAGVIGNAISAAISSAPTSEPPPVSTEPSPVLSVSSVSSEPSEPPPVFAESSPVPSASSVSSVSAEPPPVPSSEPSAAEPIVVESHGAVIRALNSRITYPTERLQTERDVKDLTHLKPQDPVEICATINDLSVTATIDSGCGHIIISANVAERLRLAIQPSKELVNGFNSPFPIPVGMTEPVILGIGPHRYKILPLVGPDNTYDVLLGTSLADALGIVTDHNTRSTYIEKVPIPWLARPHSSRAVYHVTLDKDSRSKQLRVFRHDPSVPLPARAHRDDAGFDVYAARRVVVPPHKRCCIPTGITAEAPKGTYIRVAPRSGHAVRGIDVQAGVIDRGYRGEIQVLLSNTTDAEFIVQRHSRVAQLIIERIADIEEIIPATRAKRACGERQASSGPQSQLSATQP